MTIPNRGYSLYELLVTISIASIVLVLGVPSLSGTLARSRQVAEINALFHAAHLARKESIMRRRVVSLCPSNDGFQCQPGLDWSAGWLMFENTDRDHPPRVDDGEPVLDRHAVTPGIRLTANRRGFTYRGVRLRATNGTFVACDVAGRVPPRALVISYTGRPRAAQEKPDGSPYDCAH